MVKDIVTDTSILSVPSTTCLNAHASQVQDLIDTATHHIDNCIGLAAIQIGYPIRAIVVRSKEDTHFTLMVNPIVLEAKGPKITAEEGCLSIPGLRVRDRWAYIRVMYHDLKGHKHTSKLYGWDARVVQHEMEHLQGGLV